MIGDDQLLPFDGNQALGNRAMKELDRDEIFHELPRPDPFFEFSWRIKLDLRAAVDLRLNKINPSGLPSTYAECGWVLYESQSPDELDLQKTKLIESNRHPIYNQQFYIHNPQGKTSQDGFIYVAFKDTYTLEEPLDVFYIPISALKPFIPVNLVRKFRILLQFPGTFTSIVPTISRIFFSMIFTCSEEEIMAQNEYNKFPLSRN